jgi:hypothetical protein
MHLNLLNCDNCSVIAGMNQTQLILTRMNSSILLFLLHIDFLQHLGSFDDICDYRGRYWFKILSDHLPDLVDKVLSKPRKRHLLKY